MGAFIDAPWHQNFFRRLDAPSSSSLSVATSFAVIDKLKDTIENLIELHELEAPWDAIDAAVIEARRALDSLSQANEKGV